ncbi:MAG: potassium transporter TrkG [Clostridiales bacterium]
MFLFKHQRLRAPRILVLGFAIIILFGAFLLSLPISLNDGVDVPFLDALFTSTSAVCVTGLVTMDTGNTFNLFGRSILALLIQIGGLGFSSVGVIFIVLLGRRVGISERILIKEAYNLSSLQGVVRLVKAVILATLFFEGIGVIFSFIVFSADYSPLKAFGISVFHSISAFNNAGFDILGNFQGLTNYKDNVILNLITCFLIICGGLGFYVHYDICMKRRWRSLSMHSKIVLVTTFFLLVSGTLLLGLTQDLTWLEAFFHSTSARTAGFNTVNLGAMASSGLFIICILMFIGASPGSTGGGIKTTTAFTIFRSLYSMAVNNECTSFCRRIATESVIKAFSLAVLAMSVVFANTLLISLIEPHLEFIDIFFEVVSAFATVGLTTGITPDLASWSKIILIFTMFLGRLGPLTLACMWTYHKHSNMSYVEEKIIIG